MAVKYRNVIAGERKFRGLTHNGREVSALRRSQLAALLNELGVEDIPFGAGAQELRMHFIEHLQTRASDGDKAALGALQAWDKAQGVIRPWSKGKGLEATL